MTQHQLAITAIGIPAAVLLAVMSGLLAARVANAQSTFVKRGHYIQLCGDPTDSEVGPGKPYILVKVWTGTEVREEIMVNHDYKLVDHLWVCGDNLAPGARGPLQAWVDDTVKFDGSR